MCKKKLLILLILAFVCKNAYSSHTTLLLSSQLLGGGYGFNNESVSFGGRLNLSVIPAVKFKENILIPVYSLEYNGVKDVRELVGGGTLVQQYITNMFYIKPVFKVYRNLKLKPKVGITSQIMKETQDEEWTKGLFDYYKLNFALETEIVFSVTSKLNITPSFYNVNFYNYKTLASTKYGQELTSVGKDILNFNATELTTDYKISKFFNINLYAVVKSFIDQYIVTNSGEYSSDKRRDVFLMSSFNINYPVKPTGVTTLFTSISFQTSVNNSNQNHYDVERTKFVKDYYDYTDISFSPQIVCGLNTVPLNLQFSYNIGYRKYDTRLVQDSQGNYNKDKVYSLTQYLSLIISFPVVEKLNFFIQQSYINSSSNMKYEQVYRYNYTAYNILAGVSFEL